MLKQIFLKFSKVWVPILFTLISLLIVSFITYCKAFDAGNFIILSLTLLAIIWYTFYTYQLLRKRDQIAISCNLVYIPEHEDIRVVLTNLSKEVLKVKVTLDVYINGTSFKLHPLYSGEELWILTPLNTIDGHFHLSDPLKGVDLTLYEIKEMSYIENNQKLYKISLTTEWFDNYGNSDKYPKLNWYLDFTTDSLIYDVS